MELLPQMLERLVIVEVVDHLETVKPELVVEEPVGDLDGGEHSHEVEGLPEGEAELVGVVLVPIEDELVGDVLRLAQLPSLRLIVLLLAPSTASALLLLLSASLLLILTAAAVSSSCTLDPVLIPVLFSAGEDVTNKLVLKELFPDGVGQLAEEEEEGEEVGEPEVVRGDGTTVLGDLALVHVTSRRRI